MPKEKTKKEKKNTEKRKKLLGSDRPLDTARKGFFQGEVTMPSVCMKKILTPSRILSKLLLLVSP